MSNKTTERHYLYQGPQPCGCSIIDGYCDTHSAMLRDIKTAVDDGDRFDAIWALSDGYGEPGFVPEQGYDWSGIRDSSVEAIEAMAVVAREWLEWKDWPTA